ncbi:hypothetical protein BCR39DRAFT_557051 [Naematelia encephala]|uniref:Uncharacterized protein n=1 Tax=Naematelia encephala TaxID=71784 RepID=A0A1Y2BEU7_9TREE|nr:hypothetical protein BCR39DRAFT_557051 [Naematelia encephala]
MVNITLPRLHRKRKASVLDLPYTAYSQDTNLPEKITVGNYARPPVVDMRTVLDHLTLLSAFHNTHQSMPEIEARRHIQSAGMEYQRWAQTCQHHQRAKHENIPLPPLMVLMCWHAHMLNPRVYDKDVEGAYRNLNGRVFPLADVASAIRSESLPAELDYTALSEDETLESTVWDPVDIAEAVSRQSKFVQDMSRIGWLDLNRWDNQTGIRDLQRGIVRYHAWLDLMHSTKCKHFLVPTLDIDLAWHTHQLHGKRYKHDTQELLGTFLDHNDHEGEIVLGDGLERTGRLWKNKYGYEYEF